MKQVGKSLRAAERIHKKQVAAAKARAQARAAARRAARLANGANANPQAYAQSELDRRGWGGQWSCLDALWTRESQWEIHAANASGAYGIPQALPGSKMASAGSDWQDNAATQIRWGLGYIAGRYGSPCAALSHSNSYGYY